MTLRQKTITGLFWSFIDSFAGQGISFIVGIILARILNPTEFGLIGMLAIFIAISQTFIDSGFSQSLIRKQDCTQKDYSTVFYFNLGIGVLFYFILFLCAESISRFFHEPILKDLIRVLGFSLIINSITIIQSALMTKRLDFRLQARISILSSIISGLIGIYLAYVGQGVWSLVVMTMTKSLVNAILLWYWQKWKPAWFFSRDSFKELFSFGNKLMLSGLLDTLFRNVYYFIIGKYYSAAELGYYTRADQMKSLPSSNLQGIIGRVSYTALSTLQNDIPRLREVYQKIIRSTMLVTFLLMLGLAATAKPLILTLIGEKWLPSVVYLQMLCFVGMFYPLHALNLNMLQVLGRSDLFLRLEIIKKSLAVPVIIIGIFWGIKIMILGMMVNTLIAYYLNSYWSGRYIGYSMAEQIKDLIPSLMIATGVNAIIFIEAKVFQLPSVFLLLLQLASAGLMFFLICEAIKLKDYIYLRTLIIEQIKKRKH